MYRSWYRSRLRRGLVALRVLLLSLVIALVAGCQPDPSAPVLPTASPLAIATQTPVPTVVAIQPTYSAIAPAGIPAVVGDGALAVIPPGDPTAIAPVTADLGEGWTATAFVRPDPQLSLAVRLQAVPRTNLPTRADDSSLAVEIQLYDAGSGRQLPDRTVTVGVRPPAGVNPSRLAVSIARDGAAQQLPSSVPADHEAVLFQVASGSTVVIGAPAVASEPSPQVADAPAVIPSVSPEPPLTRAPLPARINITAIGVDAPIAPVGLEPSGIMASPPDGHLVGWYEQGPRPGEPSNAVLDGHVDWTGRPAVFWRLHELKPGDEIVVSSGFDLQFRYVVTDVHQYRADAAPLDDVFGASSTPTLTIITCGGEFDHASREYVDRVVVKAKEA